MLVLSRKLNESIVIDGNIEITIVEIDRGKIRIGITAPGRTINRKEIHDRIEKENADAKDQG